MKLKYITMAAALALPILSIAQNVSFDTQDYKSLGVYDKFANSLFNQNKLAGNVSVVSNPNTTGNPSSKVLAFQRSRYASSLFGAKVTLSAPFNLDNTSPSSPKYVHVFMNKPVEGRTALILLGNRKEGNPEAEQWIVLSKNTVTANGWKDAVFPVYGSNGVRVTSLVIVPDCETRAVTDNDFMAYMDSIVVNTSGASRTVSTRVDYTLNFDEEGTKTGNNAGRYISTINFNGATSGNQTITVPSTVRNLLYDDMTATTELTAKPGEVVTPAINVNGNWQNGYVYIDYNQDGKFTPTLNTNYTIPAGSEIVTYSYIETVENTSGFKSDGSAVSGSNRNTMTCPAFTIPATTPSGRYRIRFKADWGSADPAGSTTSDANNFTQNCGTIVDALVNIHGDKQNIVLQTRNGDVFNAQGTDLGTEVEYGKALTVKLVPALGFKQAGFTLRHGYNLSSDSVSHSNKQWSEVIIPASAVAADGTYTIPAAYVDGDIMINAEFASATGVNTVKAVSGKVSAKAVKGGIQVKGNGPFVVVTVDGKTVAQGVVSGAKTLTLPVGAYLVNNKKVICKE